MYNPVLISKLMKSSSHNPYEKKKNNELQHLLKMQIQNLYFSSGKPFIHVNKFIDFLQKNFGFNFDEQNDYFEIQNQIIENLYDLKFLMMIRINHDVFSNDLRTK